MKFCSNKLIIQRPEMISSIDVNYYPTGFPFGSGNRKNSKGVKSSVCDWYKNYFRRQNCTHLQVCIDGRSVSSNCGRFLIYFLAKSIHLSVVIFLNSWCDNPTCLPKNPEVFKASLIIFTIFGTVSPAKIHLSLLGPCFTNSFLST